MTVGDVGVVRLPIDTGTTPARHIINGVPAPVVTSLMLAGADSEDHA